MISIKKNFFWWFVSLSKTNTS